MITCIEPVAFVPFSRKTDQQICQEGEEIFKRFGSGLFLDKFGVKCALSALKGSLPTKEEVRKVLPPGQRGCDFETWIRFVYDWRLTQDPSDRLRQTFRLLDAKCTGFISRADWVDACQQIAPTLSQSVMDDAFDAVDANRDDLIDCEEFVALMAAIALYSH